MNEVPTYQPPEGVHGPTLGRDLPDGCERLGATWDPHTASADRWLASGAAVDEYLYWWRFPPLKVGDTVQLTGTVTKKYGGDGLPCGAWCMVRIDGDETPGWAFDFPTAALTRVVTP